ncbi:MAG: RDD family protein [Streptosporangiaceae bacterium]
MLTRPHAAASAAKAGIAASAQANVVLAPRWRRLLAFVIDAAILTVVTGALWGRLLASFANRLGDAMTIDAGRPGAQGAVGRVFSHTTGLYLMVLAATIILAVLYYWLLTGYWGTTVGKRSLGLWVVTADDLTTISLRISALRALVFVLGGEVLPLFFLIDNGWLLGDKHRQTLHDKIAKTVVVMRRT